MDMFVRASSAWKRVLGGLGGDGTAVRAGGSWKSVIAMWVRAGGEWKQFFLAFRPNLDEYDGQTFAVVESTPGTARSGIRTSSNGTLERRTGPFGEDWTAFNDAWGRPLITDIGDEFEVRLDVESGDGPDAGAATGTWLDQASQHFWQIERSANGTTSGQWRLRYRRKDNEQVVADGTATITATKIGT